MEVFITILLIGVVMVNLIDLSGFIDSVEWWLSRTLNIKARIPKPFSCSYCMTHHIAVLYLLIAGHLTLLNYVFVLLVAYLTPQIKDTLILLSTGIQSLLNLLQNLIDR